MMQLIPWLWVILSIIIGVVAFNKGISGFGYTLLSLLLSPITAMIILAVSGPNREVVEKRELLSGMGRACPNCKEMIKFDALTCKQCHTDLSKFAANEKALLEKMLRRSVNPPDIARVLGLELLTVNRMVKQYFGFDNAYQAVYSFAKERRKA